MNGMNVYPVVLSGGVGTRLWPASRRDHPKQLHALTSASTMLQETLRRVGPAYSRGEVLYRSPVIVCNAAHQDQIEAQILDHAILPYALIAEPVGRNTAPAAALAALVVAQKDPGGVLLILPADHHISDEDAFRSGVDRATRLAREGYVVTFGIKPARPETGYGYIAADGPIAGAPGGFAVSRFVEKPALADAQQYVAQGDYFWNGGIFTVKVDVLIAEMEKYCPRIIEVCRAALDRGARSNRNFRPAPEVFADCPSDSLDYAVMEHTDKAAIVPVDMGWNDVGSWSAIYDVGTKDAEGNVTSGDVVLVDCRNALVRAESRVVAVSGLENVIVVETDDAVLVTTREQAQNVKVIVQRLKAAKPDVL